MPALGHIRLGHRAQAEGQLARLIPLPAGSDAEARLRADLLQYAFDERFRPLQGRMKRALLRFTACPELVEGLFRFARLANFFDLPGAQIALGRILETKGTGISERASGAEAQALGLLLSGRTREGLSKLDQAAALLRSPEAEFQALEWRVMLPLVGLPGPGDTERQRARAALVGTSGPFAARAAWVSALAAMEDRDTSAALRWHQTLAVQASTNLRYGPLLRLLDAVRAGADNDPARALALSDSIAPYEPGGIGGDPFARAVLYLRRAEWQRLTGAGNAADHTLLFTQAWDTHEWPQREAQSGEVDVVVGALARLRRAAVAASAGRDADASILATRVCEIWKTAGPEYQALRRQARTLAGGRCG